MLILLILSLYVFDFVVVVDVTLLFEAVVEILVRLQFFTSCVKDSTMSEVLPRCSLKTMPEAAGDTGIAVEGVRLAVVVAVSVV